MKIESTYESYLNMNTIRVCCYDDLERAEPLEDEISLSLNETTIHLLRCVEHSRVIELTLSGPIPMPISITRVFTGLRYLVVTPPVQIVSIANEVFERLVYVYGNLNRHYRGFVADDVYGLFLRRMRRMREWAEIDESDNHAVQEFFERYRTTITQ